HWQEESGSDAAVITRGAPNTYVIAYTTSENGSARVGRFNARLGPLGHRTLLDVWPAPAANDLPAPHTDLMVGGHALFDIDVHPDVVHLTMLDVDSLSAALQSGALRLRSTRSRNRLILLGTTAELRTALLGYLSRPGALGDPGTWRRVVDTSNTVVPAPPAAPLCWDASAWPAADQLFHRDPHWVGSDGASSVDLGGGRTLWLFGDSWIDPSGAGTRHGARLVSSSIAIQTGTDPSSAEIKFYWGRAADGTPAAFVPNPGSERLWFGNGIRVGNHVVLFMNRIRNTNSGLGFEAVGWNAFMVENPDDDPAAWRVTPIETPTNVLGVQEGVSAVLRLGAYVYAFGSEDPVKSHPLYVARWLAGDVESGTLLRPEWWAGQSVGWVPDSSRLPRWPLFEDGAPDLTIQFDERSKAFVVVQTVGFPVAAIAVRAASTLTGPWSAPRLLYRPPEYSQPDAMIYSAKAHPELTGADLVVTYATNTLQFSDQLTDAQTYYPHFVRLARCRSGPPR
ncbi:MAG: DUF4185 domain-containing protein, partial [Gemmatimonadaceae bacterium]